MMKDKIKKLIPIICLLPFIAGTAGYVLSGEKVTDALYASFALYFVNPVSDGYNMLVETARWTAALVTTTAVLFVMKGIWTSLLCWLKCLSKESVAVYCDSDIRIAFDRNVSAIYPGRCLKPVAKSHIIMLDSDMDNLKFYEANRSRLKGKSVYIGLREIECGLMKDDQDVIFYDINGSIARQLWKSISVWKRGKNHLTISIYGSDALAQNILNYGLLLNLYSDEQQITYHMISDNMLYKVRHHNLKTGNRDQVACYLSDDEGIWDLMRQSDIVIISEQVPAELLQTICTTCRSGEIYYYSPMAGDVGDYLQLDNVKSFGRNQDILTDENIRQEKLIEKAKKLNEGYAVQYGGEKDWNKLNGFLKWSNISSADFNEILGFLHQSGLNTDIDKLAELEHIRWCRFHYLNYWTHGTPDSGKSKDADKRIHKCLIDYSELSEEEKDKDRAVVESAIKDDIV